MTNVFAALGGLKIWAAGGPCVAATWPLTLKPWWSTMSTWTALSVRALTDGNDVKGVVSDANDVLDGLDENVDLFRLTVRTQGNDDSGVVLGVDLGQLTVWGQGSDVDGFGRSSGADPGLEDENVDLFQLTVWIQGIDNRTVLDDNRTVLDGFGGWDNVDDVGFGHSPVQCFQLKLVGLVEGQGIGALLACPLTLELCLGCRVKLLCLFPASPDHLFLVSFQFRGLLPLTVLQHRPCHSGDGGQWYQDAFQMYVVPPFFEVSLFTG